MQPRSSDDRVIFFGSFDPLHEGHRNAFAQAKALGGFLTVIVSRDSTIVRDKHRTPSLSEQARLLAVAADPSVDSAVLGDSDSASYAILRTIPFEILAIGYDQAPSDAYARKILESNGLHDVKIVRLSSYMPEVYKSSLLRKG